VFFLFHKGFRRLEGDSWLKSYIFYIDYEGQLYRRPRRSSVFEHVERWKEECYQEIVMAAPN